MATTDGRSGRFERFGLRAGQVLCTRSGMMSMPESGAGRARGDDGVGVVGRSCGEDPLRRSGHRTG